MSLIKVENLKFGYGRNLVLSDVSFEVREGDYISIVGENGSGKTTLLKILLGIISKYDGEVDFRPDLSRKNIGYLAQQLKNRGDFPASVKEIVMSGFLSSRRFAFFYTQQEKKKAFEVMSLTGIKDIVNCNFSELSGGQQQRVLLARALCAADKLLLLDEPASALDPNATAEFYALLKKLNSEGITIVMVSHDVVAAVRNSSHILCLEGENSFFGTSHQFVHSKSGSKMLLSVCPCDDCSRKAGEN